MPLHVSRCDQCGQFDDHPKVHALLANGDFTFHHDCLPADVRAQVIDTSEHGKSIIEAAESGVHGHDLRAHIFQLHGQEA